MVCLVKLPILSYMLKVKFVNWFWQYQGSFITAFDEARQLWSTVALMSKVIKAGLEALDPRKYIEVSKINQNMKKLIWEKF